MNKKEKITVTLKNYNRSLNKGWIDNILNFESLTEAEQWLKKEGYELFECRMEKNNYYDLPGVFDGITKSAKIKIEQLSQMSGWVPMQRTWHEPGIPGYNSKNRK